MNNWKEFWAQVDDESRLVLPEDVAASLNLAPGSRVRFRVETNSLAFSYPLSYLAKVYIEPTNRCNLTCLTCVRNVWDEPTGDMRWETFSRILDGLMRLPSPPVVSFGGYGEPLAHPDIIHMVAQAKPLASRVELITNGTLLSEALSRQLIATGLDLLWVSLDGATPESYADVRLGAELPKVIENVAHFSAARPPAHLPHPEIGIAFVAMQRNITDLPDVLRLGARLGATRFLMTNILPHTQQMRAEILYEQIPNGIAYLPSVWVPKLDLPRMDLNNKIGAALYQATRRGYNLSINGDNLGRANDRCPFIARGAIAISWQGAVSPCLPLMHSYSSFLNKRQRFSSRYVIGSLDENDLIALWNLPEHLEFRQCVQKFDFSPCTFCGGCELAESNEEDCYGNTYPTCGGCLWAQGVIQCP